MRIIEVRDGFIKFEADKDIALSSFMKITDTEKNYIAQVVQVKQAGQYNIAYAKILFIYDGDLQNYDKTMPSKDSSLEPFSFELLNKSFEYNEPIITGCFINEGSNINLDKKYFNKKTLISFDSIEHRKTIISNLTKQFTKTLTIDFSGELTKDSFIASKDFKLPLNTESLEFMYEDCLTDATSDSKSLVKEIFQDLANYSKTVPFLPFTSLKNIVDDMVDKSHVFKLLVLKNKLVKFDKLGYFATSKNEVDYLNNILSKDNTTIDLSKLDPTFQNRYYSVILSTLQKLDLKPQIIVNCTNTLSKKNLKNSLLGDFSTTLIVNSKFKYINDIKEMFVNFLIEPNFINNEVFKTYSTFLSSMPKDSYLIIGEGTNYIPFVSSLKEIKDVAVPNIPQEIIEEVVEIELEEENLETDSEINSVEITENIEQTIETDCHIEAIEKQSDSLIEKVAEEIEQTESPTDLNLFEENEDEIDSDESLSEELVENTEFNKEYETNSFEQELNDEESSNNSSQLLEVESITLTENDIENSNETFSLNLDEVNSVDNQDFGENFHTQIDEVKTIEVPEEISELTDYSENTKLEDFKPEVIEEIEDETNTKEYSEDFETLQEIPSIIPKKEEFDDEEFDTIVELDEMELQEGDIIVDFDDEEETISQEDLDKAIVEDVDKVFTTMKDDSISDSDLDFIDELNDNEEEEVILSEGMEELAEYQDNDSEDGFLEVLEETNGFIAEGTDEKEILETKNASTPIVPVYGADIPSEDLVVSDSFEQGDTVIHTKYGNGIVEKMIKYGTKTLYSINFDNVGRRLLDPTLTEIKKA